MDSDLINRLNHSSLFMLTKWTLETLRDDAREQKRGELRYGKLSMLNREKLR